MKKISILLIALMVISVGFLSGCTQQTPTEDENGNSNYQPIDSDGDGYPDDEDDFPTDSNLHKKIVIDSGSVTHKPHQGSGGAFEVESDAKYVTVNWEVISPSFLTEDEQYDIYFYVRHPPNEHQDTQYKYDNIENRDLRFTIDSSNWGRWEYGFGNTGINADFDVTIKQEIYILK